MKKIVLSLFLTAAAFSATAQEFIRNVPILYPDTSIIRVVDTNSRLVYNFDGVKPGFFLYTDGASTVPILNLPIGVHILDFMVDYGVARFCGYRVTDDKTSSTEAIWGSFALSTFPATTVYYSVDTELVSLNKIDVFSQTDSWNIPIPHVVMLGTLSSTMSSIVDVIPLTGEYHKTRSFTIFDDLTMTNNYIVMTSHDTLNHIWMIRKPVGAFSPHHIFSVDPIRYDLSSYYPEKQFVQSMFGDTIAVVGHFQSHAYLDIGWYTNNTNITPKARIPLTVDQNHDNQIVDVKFNKEDRELDVMMSLTEYGQKTGLALHMDRPLYYYYGATIIPAHLLPSQIVHSFDNGHYTQRKTYFASGMDGKNPSSFLYKYTYGCAAASCFLHNSFLVMDGNVAEKPQEGSLWRCTMEWYTSLIMDASPLSLSVEEICK